MANMQKAIVYKGPGEFAYEDRPIPEIKDRNDVKIKSYGCAVCGTDVNIFATPQKHPCKPDIIFGHEFCGEVAEVGEGVTDLKPGDKVVIDPHGPCGECDNCLAGLPEACQHVSSRGVFADGGLTNYVVLPKQYCYKVAPETKPELMGVAEPLAGCGCALEKLNVHVGDTACVLGAGPIGLMLVDCVYLVRPHGKVLQFGHDELARPEFPVAELLKNEIEVYGGYLGKYYMRKVAQIIESGILPLDKIVTDVIPASRYQEALDLAASRQCGKVFVSMDL